MNIKKILGYLILFLHGVSLPISIIIFTFFNFVLIDYLILIYFSFVLIGWILFGNCILTPLENYLLSKKETYNDNTERSRITIFLENTLKIDTNTIYIFCTILPVIIIFIVLIKLLFVYKK